MRRPILIAGLIFTALVACKDLTVPVVIIPDGYTIYRIDPTQLQYHFVDSLHAPRTEYTWLPGEPFVGANCIGLSPRSHPDTTGAFVFSFNGANRGRLLRQVGVIVDSTEGIFLLGLEGTGGNYAITSSSGLNLAWSSGSQERYFAPNAVIRMSADGDTIASDMSQTTDGGSIAFEWHVRWLRSTFC